MQQYLHKTAIKANQIKSMSDQLFERFYISGKDEVMLEPPQKVKSVFEGRLSDLIMFLESQGFGADCDASWPGKKISISGDYIDRILDNVTSNIQKYADSSEPIRISLKVYEKPESPEQIVLTFRNKIKESLDGVESTQVGILNIRHMMSRMNGECVVKDDHGHYEMALVLPVV